MNERVGIITAAIAAVYANLWVHDAIVTSETITIFMVAVTVLAAYRFWKVPLVADAPPCSASRAASPR